jgi:hypothetical protein
MPPNLLVLVYFACMAAIGLQVIVRHVPGT